MSSAKTPSDPAPISAPASTPTSAAQSAEGAGAASNLGAREQQSRNLQDFKGGSVAIYASSGAVLVAVIILLILLV